MRTKSWDADPRRRGRVGDSRPRRRADAREYRPRFIRYGPVGLEPCEGRKLHPIVCSERNLAHTTDGDARPLRRHSATPGETVRFLGQDSAVGSL